MFSAALASGQLGPLMCQFGLPAEAVEAANKGGKYLSLTSVEAEVVFSLHLKAKASPVGLWSSGLACPHGPGRHLIFTSQPRGQQGHARA